MSKESSSEVKIGMGVQSGDHEVYPDCRAEFRDADLSSISTW